MTGVVQRGKCAALPFAFTVQRLVAQRSVKVSDRRSALGIRVRRSAYGMRRLAAFLTEIREASARDTT